MIHYIIQERDKKLWNDIINNEDHPLFDLLFPKKIRYTREQGRNFILLLVQTERFKRTFINRSQHRGQMFAHARVVRRRSRRTSTDDDDSTSLPMVVDCSDTSLVGMFHNFHCEHCCLLCFLALVLDCDNNSCKDF